MTEYPVICVQYSDDPITISYVGLYSKEGALPTHPRSMVISNLDAGHKYRTYFKENGKWFEGAFVQKTSNGKFITTDPNETEKDNLGNLLNCQPN